MFEEGLRGSSVSIVIWNDEHLEMSPNRIKTGCFYSIFTNYQLPSFKRDLNGNLFLFWNKPGCLNGEKYTLNAKNSIKFIFILILNTVFGVFLKIDNRAFTDLSNKMQQTCKYSQPEEIRTRRLGTAHSTKAL